MVDQSVRDEDEGVDAQHGPRARIQAEERSDELGAAIVHTGNRGDQTRDVDPSREPAPARAPQRARPVIHAARSGKGRGEFGHAGRDREREQRHQRPAERHLGGSAFGQAVAVKRHRSGEDGNDRKRDGEVGEPSHGAEEFLRVAEAPQILYVSFDSRVRSSGLLRHSSSKLLGSAGCSPEIRSKSADQRDHLFGHFVEFLKLVGVNAAGVGATQSSDSTSTADPLATSRK